jgi:hypothetical protein
MPAGRRRGRPASARRGALAAPRTGTLVNWSLYRLGWLVVLLPALLVLIGARTPGTLPAPTLPATFDGAGALALTTDVSHLFSDRSPGSGGGARAAAWVEDRLRAARLSVSRQRFTASDASGRPVRMENILAISRGSSRDAIVVIAPRDDIAPGPSANATASGTGLLLELARTLVGTVSQKTLVLASTDGSTAGDAGARYLAAHPPPGLQIGAVLSLANVARPGPVSLAIEGDGLRRPAAGLVQSVEAFLHDHGIPDVRVPTVGRQVASLLVPLGRGEQSAFTARGIPGVAIGGQNGGRSPAQDRPEDLSASRLGNVGTAIQSLVLAFDQGPPPDSPSSSYLLSSDRVVRGWTIAILLVALLVPPALPLADLLTRMRRRSAPLWPAVRSFGERLVVPLVFVGALRVEGALGIVPNAHQHPFPGQSAGMGVVGLGVPILLAAAAAILMRGRRGRVAGDPADAGAIGFGVALAGVLAGAAVTLTGNPYALILFVPAAHLWLVLPYLSRYGVVARLGLVALGWVGVAAVVALVASADGLGWTAPGWILRLAADGSIPFAVSAGIAVLAAATSQLGAIVSGRYAAAGS